MRRLQDHRNQSVSAGHGRTARWAAIALAVAVWSCEQNDTADVSEVTADSVGDLAFDMAGDGQPQPDPGKPPAEVVEAADLAAPVSDVTDATMPDLGSDGTGDVPAAPDTPADDTAGDTTEPPANPDCDPLLPAVCAMPWPSNLYLVADASRVTGYTLTFGPTSLPQNFHGNHIAPEPYQRLDGYGLGTPLMVQYPNLDVSAMATEADIAASLAADAPIVWLAVKGADVQRVAYWAELDAHESDPAKKTLFVRAAVILDEATRYVVAFRNLRDTAGQPVAPSPAFAKLLAGDTAADPQLAPRQDRFDDIFGILQAQGISKDGLVIAWDFVTASCDALHGRMLAMREDGFAAAGPQGPELTITSVEEFVQTDDGSGKPVDEYIALDIQGTFRVPHFMETWRAQNVDGWVFHLGPDGRPQQNGWRDARFWVRVPHTALDGTPHGLMLYGHGLNGSGDQVRSGFNSRIAATQHLILFAADLVGMSEEDGGRTFMVVVDLTLFPWLADRLHQGMLEYLLLARGMHERLADLPEIASRGIVINRDELFYSGISQGGIFGATFMALSPDIRRGHLGVPGNNYSTLLHRSVDFAEFFMMLSHSYTDTRDVAVNLSLIDQLWEGTEPVSYMRHVKAFPFAGDEPHDVLLAPAKGDYQVANVTNEVAARSGLGLRVMAHYSRSLFGINEQDYPYTGSGIVMYDFGNPWPPPGNLPPREDELGDPHEKPRRQDHHNEQMLHFLRTGEIIDVCGGDGCTPD